MVNGYSIIDVYNPLELYQNIHLREMKKYFSNDISWIILGFVNPNPGIITDKPNKFLIYKNKWEALLKKKPKGTILGKEIELILWANVYRECNYIKFLWYPNHQCYKDKNMITKSFKVIVVDDGSLKLVCDNREKAKYIHIHNKFDWDDVIDVRPIIERL